MRITLQCPLPQEKKCQTTFAFFPLSPDLSDLASRPFAVRLLVSTYSAIQPCRCPAELTPPATVHDTATVCRPYLGLTLVIHVQLPASASTCHLTFIRDLDRSR